MKKIKITKYVRPQFLLALLLILAVAGSAWYAQDRVEPVSTKASICDFYVTTTGSSTGDGSANSPWDLRTAFAGPASVQDGDTICIRQGTYQGRFISKLSGSAGQPITVRAYPGERVTIDGYNTTTLTATTNTPNGYVNDGITVADPSIFTLNEGMIAFIGGFGGEMIRVDNLISGTTINVVRGWGGSCGGSPCQAWPSGTEVRLGGAVLTTRGSYTNLIGLEVTISNQTSRVIGQNGGVDDGGGIVDDCDSCKYINNVVHDVSGGFGSFGTGKNSEFYGNIAYNVGVIDANLDPSGHGFYIQNTNGNPVKTLKHNISFHNANFGYQSYADSGGLDNITYDGNIAFNNGVFGHQQSFQLLVGRDPSFSNNIIDNSEVYSSYGSGSLNPCYGGTTSTNGKVRNNYVVGSGAEGWNCPGLVEVTGNTALGTANLNWPVPAGNTVTYTLPTTGVRSVIHPNQYEQGRAHLTIYNWAQTDSVSVDISGAGLSNGQSYEVRDVQNFYGSPVATGTYNGSAVSIDMTSSTTPQLIGASPKQPFHTSKQFGVFVIIPTTNGNPTPTAPTISSFTASPSTITAGQSATLSWSVSNADTLLVNQNVGTVTGTSTSVSPTATTTYILTATNSGGTTTANATVTVNAVPPSQVATPTISPNGGTFTSAQSVSLTTTTSGAEVRYTTNGSTPTSTSTLYVGPFTVSATSTVKVIAIKSGMTDSAVSSATFTINTRGGGGGGGSSGGGGGGGKPKPTKPKLTEASNFVCTGGATVYFYYNGVKEAYSEYAVYQAWNGSSFANITTLTAEECTTIEGTSIVRMPEGTFVKVASDPTIYKTEGTTARPYASYEAFKRDSVGKTVYTITIPYLHTYSRGADIR